MPKVISPLQVAMAFGTPVSTHLWPDSDDLNAGLRRLVLEAEAQGDGQSRSNVGGWHSVGEFLGQDAPEIATLRQRIGDMAHDIIGMTGADAAETPFRIRLTGWANVNRRGDYNQPHMHGGSIWSGVYYVSSGAPDDTDALNGKLELFDPRPAAGFAVSRFAPVAGKFTVDPIPGLMIFFPSWLSHMAHPFRGKGERISIAFNVAVEAA